MWCYGVNKVAPGKNPEIKPEPEECNGQRQNPNDFTPTVDKTLSSAVNSSFYLIVLYSARGLLQKPDKNSSDCIEARNKSSQLPCGCRTGWRDAGRFEDGAREWPRFKRTHLQNDCWKIRQRWPTWVRSRSRKQRRRRDSQVTSECSLKKQQPYSSCPRPRAPLSLHLQRDNTFSRAACAPPLDIYVKKTENDKACF